MKIVIGYGQPLPQYDSTATSTAKFNFAAVAEDGYTECDREWLWPRGAEAEHGWGSLYLMRVRVATAWCGLNFL